MSLFHRTRTDERRREAPRAVAIELDGRSLPLTVRRSARAQRYTLRLAPTGDLVLTLPARGTLERGLAFAQAQTGWIRQRVARLPQRVAFEEGAVIPLRGAEHVIRHAGSRRGTVSTVDPSGSALPEIRVAGDPAHLSRRLADWLKAQARRDLERAATGYAGQLKVTFRRVGVRDQTSRWGSCSAGGTLSFSWRLILAPPMVLDYLAAHEVAHLVEMNHSARFWRIVRRIAPHTNAAEAWLKRNGAGLHRYGAG